VVSRESAVSWDEWTNIEARRALTLFGQACLKLPDQIAGDSREDLVMQISGASTAQYTPQPAAVAEAASAQIVDLTQLAVAQTNAKATAEAGAALAQTTGELTGTVVNISV